MCQIHADLEKDVANPAILAIACFLVRHGANIDVRNQRQLTPAFHVTDEHILGLLRHYSRYLQPTVTCLIYAIRCNSAADITAVL